jgi:ABC-type multidrug transport system permease subunit
MSLEKPNGEILVIKSIKYGFIGAGISLGIIIIWIVWYEYFSGYSAGNAPVGWIIFYGPLSFAIGQIMALHKWWKNAL